MPWSDDHTFSHGVRMKEVIEDCLLLLAHVQPLLYTMLRGVPDWNITPDLRPIWRWCSALWCKTK